MSPPRPRWLRRLQPPRWRRRSILLLGVGRIADACARLLGAERVQRCATSELAAAELAAADILILAGTDDPEPWLAALRAPLQAEARHRPLRVLLIDAERPWSRAAARPLLPASLPSAISLERVAIAQRAARQLLIRWPLHWGADPGFGPPMHLLILGENALAEALLVQALRIGQYGPQRLQVTVLAATCERLQRDFEQAFPQAGKIAAIRFAPLADPPVQGAPPVTMAVVCCEPSERALEQAAALGQRLAVAGQSPPLLLEVGEAEPAGALADWDGQLIPFSRLALALEPEALLEGRGDELAQVIHEHYRDTIEAQGRDPTQAAAGQPWEQLPHSYREANRQQADHLWAKLALTDCRAEPEERVEAFAFAPIEVEQLAMIEHARWAADRWLDGWSYAPQRDDRRKQHPQLIPYKDLSGPMKDLDRFAVRLAPTLLARSGLGILRMLLVGVVPSGAGAMHCSERLMRRALVRLKARYPDRALVVAASVADPSVVRFARLAVKGFGTGFFLLLEQPLTPVLARLDASARPHALELISRAERRIQLMAPEAFQRWLETRVEIRVELGAGQVGGSARETEVGQERKRVRIDPHRGLDWNFEY